MKTTFKLMAAVSVASMLFGSQAFAGNDIGQHRLAERNAAYFKQAETQTASSWTPSSASSEPGSAHQRMGQRNAEYFSGKTKDGSAEPAVAKPVVRSKKH